MKVPVSSLSMNNEETEHFYTYGFSQYEGGNYKEAIEVFRILCTNHPTVSRFWFALGASLQQAGQYEESLRAWAIAAMLSPKDPMPHFHAAECYLSVKNLKDALFALKETTLRTEKEDPLNEQIDLIKQQWSL